MSVLTVALTGGIATGKSVVAGLLLERGCFVQSADRIAHDLMKPGRPAWKEIVAHFGTEILSDDRTINRKLLGRIIFSSDRQRHFLNGLVHPLVMAKKKSAIRRLEKQRGSRIYVSEAALTVEAGYASFYDKVIVVQCPEKLQVDRLIARDGMTRSEARKRVQSQLPGAQKAESADYLIDTSGSLEETAAQTHEVYLSLLNDLRRKQARERRFRAKLRPPARRREAGS